jgi:hypothetical protein
MMSALVEPPIVFSPWTAWANRASLKRTDGPWVGLYIWGHFEGAPPTGAPYPELPEELAYVGETKHLDKRPLSGPHHRTLHYRETFKDDPNLERLFLSVARVRAFPGGYTDHNVDEYLCLRVYTRHIEARIYWEYTKKWKKPPALHYKRPPEPAGEPE